MQWHLDSMQAEQMWKTSTGKGVTVAVIDSGVASVPELEGQVLPGKDLADGYQGDERTDYDSHGTKMAALIAGTGKGPGGGDGAFGLAPGAKILPIRVPNEGNRDGMPSWVAAIRYAADSEAKILNISLGQTEKEPQLQAAVKYAIDKGKLVFASVGNSGSGQNLLEYPAGTPGVIGVAAIDQQANATTESQHGPQVDLAAPGVDIVTACTGKTGLCKAHGTSDATALASASAALIWSAHPDWTNNQVLRVLLNTAGKPRDGVGRNDYIGYGVVRPRIALTNPGDPGSATEWPLPDLAAAAPAGGSSPSAGGGTPSQGAPAPAAAKEGDGLPWTWIGLGLAACVLIGGAVTAVVVRRQNR
ncbi:type VII secretion-associated serine protease mycosin [Streptomyces sp. WAC06614]|uniref:type VII secretion-associated serine protease mycosin n=1 Tax=Streptomyces sp. WAC06614 TaxID=2487416 RepID=UPI0028A75C84|nr:type VII secretion-associated serine protease mycosin [Streptomyces sp. WAC06614]